MIPITTLAGRRVALFGLGGSGLATALALRAGGAQVVAFDDSPERVAVAAGQGVGTGNLRDADWSGFAALVLAPGVPLTHPEPHWTVSLAAEAGVPVIGDIELFCRERAALAPQAPFVAITGTNGKSTTTALIAHVLREAGRDVQMGGNIGTAILSLEPPAPGRIHVVEMSSYQIDLTPSLAPTVGILLNVSPDHLDRHGTMEHYASIKERLVAAADHVAIGIDDDWTRAIADRLRGRPNVTRISVEGAAGADLLSDGSRIVDPDGRRPALDVGGIGALRGLHNVQNAAMAAVACRALGLTEDEIARGMRSFPGLAHRMEQVGRAGGVLFVNDSKATNADSTEKALSSFGQVFWVLGGKAKEGGIAALAPYFPRVTKAYMIGEATDAFAVTLDGHVPYERCGTLDVAVARAARDAAETRSGEEPVVLFSPACASFDQFKNFEERGNRFRDLVRELPGFDTLTRG